jgi:sec-independent protein translocase protein TatB
MIVVFIVVLVVFGPQKLPELARGLGKLMAEFRKASTDFRSAFEEEMREMERQTLQAGRKKAAEAVAASAAAEPSQPAALATPAGTETPANETPPESATTEALVVSSVAEAVPRSTGESVESKPKEADAGANLQESPHDTEHPA